MERIAELKALRKEEERRQRLESERKEEEERIRNQSAAEKYVNRLVGKIRLPMMDQQHHNDDSNPNMTKHLHHLHNTNNHRISPQDYHHENGGAHHHPHHTTTTTTTTDNHNNHRTSFIAVPTGARVSMIANPSTSTNTARRASSALIDVPWTNNARRRSSAESSSKSNDDNTNLAPRRGFVVLDMIHGGVDDGGGGGGGGGGSNRSVLSYHSNGSGIFSIANSDLDGSSRSGMSGMSGLYIDEDNVPSTLCSSPEAERKRQKYSPSVAAGGGEVGGGDGRVEDALTRMLVPYPSSSGGDIDHDQTFPPAADGVLIHERNDDELSPLSSTRRHRMLPQCASSITDGDDDDGKDSKSESSLSTTDFSRSSSDGLIVGFGDRSRRNNDVGDGDAAEDKEDDLIVGFVDRHMKVR